MANQELIKRAEEIADGFGYSGLKWSGAKEDNQDLIVANIITELINAIEKLEREKSASHE